MNLLFTLLIISGVIILIFMLKKLNFRQIMLCIFSGLAALLCCDNVMSFIVNDFLPINYYTLAISAIGGIPGVILLTLLKMLL